MASVEVNGHSMYYEVHGDGAPVLCMGGWGTFCHGEHRTAPRSIFERHRVVMFDYRGVGESTDDPTSEPSTALFARDAAALLDHLSLTSAHVIGLVGMGACVGQELAIARPDLVRSLFMTGTWARSDAMWADQLELFRRIHLRAGFDSFQMMAAACSFPPDFYQDSRDRILGPDGAWKALRGRAVAHSRLVQACIGHDTLDRLDRILCPALVVHALADVITGPRLTRPLEEGIPNARGYEWPDAAHIIAGKEQRSRLDRVIEDFLREVEAGEAVRARPSGTAAAAGGEAATSSGR